MILAISFRNSVKKFLLHSIKYSSKYSHRETRFLFNIKKRIALMCRIYFSFSEIYCVVCVHISNFEFTLSSPQRVFYYLKKNAIGFVQQMNTLI